MHISEFDYCLPQELIAQEPLAHRAESRLLVLHQATGQIEHRQFAGILDYLQQGDVVVSNKTRVMPARLYGRKKETGAVIEVLLLQQIDKNHWEVLVRPGKRVKPGTRIVFGAGELEGIAVQSTASGGRIMEFFYQGVFQEVLACFGQMPLPPYIKKKLVDPERYQTVYAKELGSVAAPTAGLHFTPTLIQALQAQDIEWVEILLHVGLGTFRPVQEEIIEEHQMHREYFKITEKAAERINLALEEKRRIIAVGTTSVRALESAFVDNMVQSGKAWTEIFIYPGYDFKVLSGLITNFHLPKSTLLMLVSALTGREKIMEVYQQAVREKYRFFSFGDAMIII